MRPDRSVKVSLGWAKSIAACVAKPLQCGSIESEEQGMPLIISVQDEDAFLRMLHAVGPKLDGVFLDTAWDAVQTTEEMLRQLGEAFAFTGQCAAVEYDDWLRVRWLTDRLSRPPVPSPYLTSGSSPLPATAVACRRPPQ